jgi:hypothetical protein
MSGLLRLTGCEIPEATAYVGQGSSPDAGRPDVVGTDTDGIERILIEGKFGADLTEHQPTGYLGRLPPDRNCILLFVVPSVRVPTLWTEVLRAVPDLPTPIPAPSSISSDDLLHVALTDNQYLAISTWRRLVNHLLQALRAATEHHLASDAEQLLALTEVMDSTAYAPLRPQDLDQRTGHQIDQLHRLIDGVRAGVAADPDSLVTTLGQSPSHGRIFYGWKMQSRRTKVPVWYGFRAHEWARHGLSPLWLRATAAWPRERWLQALGGLREPGQSGLFDEGEKGFFVPLYILRFASEGEVVSNLRSQIEDIFTRLDAVVPVGEDPVEESVVSEAEAALESEG